MKLGICCNFAHPSIGGSESVIKNISERLVKNYNYDVSVYSFSCPSSFVENGVKYIPCKKGGAFISQIVQNEHIFVYSSDFWGFDTLVENIGKTSLRASCALVGAYHLQSHPESFRLLKENLDRFNLITHSKITIDYKWCIGNDLPVKVIPNGVNLSEFRENIINFREKYNIKEKYIILAVNNYFYGKGFELLPKICRKLSENLDDFIILQLSNTVQYLYDLVFLNRTQKQCKGLPVRFMRDLPREDVVAAFKASDVFLQTSKKEVAPIVILECRAAKLPYVSMKVGNIMDNPGGIPVSYQKVDKKGYVIVDDNIINHLVIGIFYILKPIENDGKRNLRTFKESIIGQGQKNIDSIDWNNIVPLYDKVFRDGI